MNIQLIKKDFVILPYEFVERKGKGHPDTLSDGLAEFLSSEYSKYTQQKYGVVLHHNFDKVGLLGGASDVGFGYGELTKPIRVLINGRASTKFGDQEIPVRELLIGWATKFLTKELPISETSRDLEFHYNLSNQSSPGKTEEESNKKKSARKYWFEPRGVEDIPELKRLFSNDTSMGVGFAPFSKLELLVLDIEKTLTGKDFKDANNWIGSDIKIMGFRHNDEFKITMCIPQIGKNVHSLNEYSLNIDKSHSVIKEITKKHGVINLELNINTRDDYDKGEIYLTAIGSSIESGDEGLVGRGNRIQGIISSTRPMSMEGVAGKNPVYHIGKIYYVAAQKISEIIFEELKIQNEVTLLSQSGRDLLDPWIILVHVPYDFSLDEKIIQIIEREIKSIPKITEALINRDIEIF